MLWTCWGMTLHAQQHYKLLRHAIGFWHKFANKTGMCCTQCESHLVGTALVQNSTPPYFKHANNPGFYKHAIMSQEDAVPEDNRVSRAPLETCIYAPPRSYIFSSISASLSLPPANANMLYDCVFSV